MFSTNKKFNLKNYKKIFLMAPANIYTGGPELTHQLGYILKNELNKDIKIYYIPSNITEPVHKNLKKYSLKFTNYIDDDPQNLLIIPEYFYFLKIANSFKKIEKAIWWQSLDNYFGSRFRDNNSKISRSILKIPFNIINLFNKTTRFFFGILTIENYLKYLYNTQNINNHDELKQAFFHLAQSNYAFDFLKKKFENVGFLSDFIREDLIQNSKITKKEKENIICYNPLKCNEFMKLLIKKNNFNFVPLINLNNDEIITTLSKSKIYIDIGSHPGKDRLPREAALLGNCIITNLKGSAANSKDVSIPNEFKFNENYNNLEKINSKIRIIFDDYEKEFKKFEYYVKNITEEKDNFINQVKAIF